MNIFFLFYIPPTRKTVIIDGLYGADVVLSNIKVDVPVTDLEAELLRQ